MNIDFAGATGDHTHFRLVLNLSQSISGNYSDLSFAGLQGFDTKVDARPIYFGITITVAGTTMYKVLFVGMNSSNGIMYNNKVSFTDCYLGTEGLVTGSVRIPHEADGQKVLTATCTGWLQQDQGFKWYFSPITVSVALPAIPRTSGISASGVALNTGMRILLTRAAAGFTDTVSWACGSASGTIATKTSLSELTWKPPLDLASQAPSSTQVPITLIVTTYRGAEQVGQGSTVVNCTIPDNIIPSVSVKLSDSTGLKTTYGSYIQNQSKLQITATGQGNLGSQCKSVQIRFGGMTSSQWETIFAISRSGTLPVEVQVTDSRGRVGSWTGSISVTAYRSPTIQTSSCFRCNSNGAENPSGSYAKVVFSGEVTSLDGRNTAAYALLLRTRGTTSWTKTTLSAYAGSFKTTNGSFIFSVSVDQAYEYKLTLQDQFTKSESPQLTLQAAFALMDFNRTQKSAGILQRASVSNTFCIGADTKHFGHRITDVGKPTSPTDAATLGSVYPIGSIYMSVNATSPATIFGGTWERIKERFLLAAGDTYWNGRTGGEATHTLTIDEMPQHSHLAFSNEYMVPRGDFYGLCTQGRTNSTGNAGSSVPHNNMPPYLAVYIWKRTE